MRRCSQGLVRIAGCSVLESESHSARVADWITAMVPYYGMGDAAGKPHLYALCRSYQKACAARRRPLHSRLPVGAVPHVPPRAHLPSFMVMLAALVGSGCAVLILRRGRLVPARIPCEVGLRNQGWALCSCMWLLIPSCPDLARIDCSVDRCCRRATAWRRPLHLGSGRTVFSAGRSARFREGLGKNNRAQGRMRGTLQHRQSASHTMPSSAVHSNGTLGVWACLFFFGSHVGAGGLDGAGLLAGANQCRRRPHTTSPGGRQVRCLGSAGAMTMAAALGDGSSAGSLTQSLRSPKMSPTDCATSERSWTAPFRRAAWPGRSTSFRVAEVCWRQSPSRKCPTASEMSGKYPLRVSSHGWLGARTVAEATRNRRSRVCGRVSSRS